MEIKIKHENSVPGFGGLNYDGLISLGWRPENYYKVVKKDGSGVYIDLPFTCAPMYVWNREIEDIKE